MEPIKHILLDEEKKIFANHFFHNKNNSKKDFQKFTEDIISHYTGQPFSLKDKEQRMNIKHSIDLIWDENTNTTAMMHLFEHKKFDFSNAKLKHLKTFNGNLNAVNDNNQTALMLLAKDPKHDYLFKSFIKDSDGFDLLAVDANNQTFHMYFFDHYSANTFNPDSSENKGQMSRYGDKFFSMLGKIDYFTEVLHHWINCECFKDQNSILFVADKAMDVAKGIREMTEHPQVKKEYRIDMILATAKEIESVGQVLHLNTILKVNEQQKPKMKI
jgi:hypothetical protein